MFALRTAPHSVFRRRALAALATFATALSIAPALPAVAADPAPPPSDRPANICPPVIPDPVPTAIGLDSSSWLVVVRTSGGLSGFAEGSFSARSDGTVWRDGCVQHLGATDLNVLNGLVSTTHDERWSATYGRLECCDQESFSVAVTRRNGRRTVTHAASTASATFETTPADYRELYGKLDAMTRAYGRLERRLATPVPAR